MDPFDPVPLELAPLPREKVGPFLILGLDKDADKEAIEANWAERVKWARKGLVNIPLEDINWARETLTEQDRRIICDAASLNSDTGDQLLEGIARANGLGRGQKGPGWIILDQEDLGVVEPAVAIPPLERVLSATPVPEVPADLPGARLLLQLQVLSGLDPWEVRL